jgi:hypothetical protein
MTLFAISGLFLLQIKPDFSLGFIRRCHMLPYGFKDDSGKGVRSFILIYLQNYDMVFA